MYCAYSVKYVAVQGCHDSRDIEYKVKNAERHRAIEQRDIKCVTVLDIYV